MNKEITEQIKALKIGDLILVEWFDASSGRSIAAGPIDIPVKSWGIFMGVFGERNKQIILAQNNFRFTSDVYDVDHTAIPLSWAVNISVIQKSHLKGDEARDVQSSFIAGKLRNIHKLRAQRRSVNSAKMG